MAFNAEFLSDLKEIITLIEAGNIDTTNGAVEKFKVYLDKISTIGPFTTEIWKRDWRKKIWEFGELFKNRQPFLFINALNFRLVDATYDNKEVLKFILSEISVNFLTIDENRKLLEVYAQEYPYNPEFRNTLGHFLSDEKKYLDAIEEYKLASKIEPGNDAYLRSRYTTEVEYLDELIKNGDYETGKEYIVSILTKEETYESSQYKNVFIDYKARIEDHIHFQSKLLKLEADFVERMKGEFDGERRRIIEVLGFFSAIVAFILTTVSIGKNFNFLEAIYFIIALGIILILFASALSILFLPSKQIVLSDIKFWILSVGLLILLAIILFSESISSILSKICND